MQKCVLGVLVNWGFEEFGIVGVFGVVVVVVGCG